MSAILEFRSVTLARVAPYDAGVASASLAVAPGAIVRIDLDHGQTWTPIGDLAMGVVDPDAGEVLFDGAAWSARPADAAASARARIGRVFDQQGWLSNLDVDENVTLPLRYHRGVDLAESSRVAHALAESLGMPGLPPGRPASVARQELRRAQWVRALLADPALLILDRPLKDLPSAMGAPLRREIEARVARGLAVLWLDERADALGLTPTLHFRFRDGNMTRVEPA